jgi:thiol-disulfide isomerase/thioredoxin
MVSIAQEKTNTINIRFEGKDYKNLELIIIMDGGSKKHFSGQSKNGKDWTFKYPDNIYNTHKYMRICVPSNVDTVSEEIELKTLINNRISRTYNFKQGISNTKAVYLKSGISNHVAFTNDAGYGVVYKNRHFDEFLVGTESDQELLSSIEDLVCGYSTFGGYNPNHLSYENQLESYINLTKKYPDSFSLVYELATSLNRYGTRLDVEKVYNCFSDKIKKTYWGEKIDYFIKKSQFSNSILPAWDAERLEPIIKDTSKYNLIAFSTSWCGPCHKLIPILKEVYRDLTGRLEIVYVSLDEPKTVENWKLLMKKEEIPWRSVLAMKDVKGISDKYTVESIPFSLLVHPNGYMEIIDLRKENDKEKLYRLVRQ